MVEIILDMYICFYFQVHTFHYKDIFAFYKDTKCLQGHAILMPVIVTGK